MKRLILSASLLLLFASLLGAEPVQLAQPERDKAFQFPFNGQWLPNIHPMHVGAQNYTALENLRYTDTGLETTDGYSHITTTALTPGNKFNGFHFKKDGESHVITKLDYGVGTTYLVENTTPIPSSGDYSATSINDTSLGFISLENAAGSFSDGPEGTMLYADSQNTLIWGGDEFRAAAVLVSEDAEADTALDGSDLVDNDIQAEFISLNVPASRSYLFVGSPVRLSSINVSISAANASASVLSGDVWIDSGWYSMTVTDGTSSGGVSLAQSGKVSFSFTGATSKLRYLNGSVLYWYRFELSAGIANIYKVTATAPLQPVQDVWNGSPRTCTSFQVVRSGAHEDYTYHVAQRSTQDAPFAATIGGIGASDSVYLMFDDRVMGIDVSMLGDKTNAASTWISSVSYWNGYDYVAFAAPKDKTRTGLVTLSQSGTISWTPKDVGSEQPKQEFGKFGYIYRIIFSGTLTDGTNHDGTSIDYLTGIAAPVKTSGYDKVGFYSGRALLIKDNKIDYSLPDNPWVYNGVNTSDIGNPKEAPLYFGDNSDITATKSLFNRYGSNIIESLVVTKKSATYLLTGSHPYADFNEPFVTRTVSNNIGCPAPMTMQAVEAGTEVTEGVRRNAVIWLDTSGPVLFDGAVLTPIKGVENYFIPGNSECVRYSYIDKATAYYDSVNSEYNLLFPSGSSATDNNAWLVYSLKHNKWYEKIPLNYPLITISVEDADGGKYNYGNLPNGHLCRMDHGNSWQGGNIVQKITTGEFSPPINDEIGFWSWSKLTGVKLISDSITEDVDVTISPYADGAAVLPPITVALNSSGPVSRNTFYNKNLSSNGYLYKFDFTASTSVDKWTPLVWGYKSQYIRED